MTIKVINNSKKKKKMASVAGKKKKDCLCIRGRDFYHSKN